MTSGDNSCLVTVKMHVSVEVIMKYIEIPGKVGKHAFELKYLMISSEQVGRKNIDKK